MNRELLKSRNYRAYVSASVATSVGTWVQKTAVGWHVYQQARSAEAVAWLVIADAVPFLVFCLHAGWIADRIPDKLAAWRACYLAQAASTFGLLGVLAWQPQAHGAFYLAIAVGSALQTLQGPLGQVCLRTCFRKEEQVAIASTNSIVNNVSRFVGAWVGAAAYGALGIHGAIALNAVSFVFPYLVFRQLSPIADATPQPAGHAALFGGVRYIAGHGRLLRQFMLLACTCVLGRPIVDQIPSIAGLSPHGSVNSAAHLFAAVGVGALAAALLVPQAARRLATDKVSVGGAAIIAAASLGIGLSLDSAWRSAVFGTLGFGMVAHGVGMISFLQEQVDGAFLGRVFALFSLVLRGLVAAGALALGWAADLGQLVPALWLSATVIAVAAALGALSRHRASTAGPASLAMDSRKVI